MSRKRLTREDSRDQTRQRLLDAAQKLIAKKGLSAASVEDIAEAAGYTRGAFYSNFNSKGDLFIALLRRDHQDGHIQFDALRSDELSVDFIRRRTRDLYGQLYRNNESFVNWIEARLLAGRDTKFRVKFNALLEEKCGRVAEFVEYFHQRLGIKPSVSPQTMAKGFIALVDGVNLSMLSSPTEMTPETAETILLLFFDALVQASVGPAAPHPDSDR